MINWRVTREEWKLIAAIAQRAVTIPLFTGANYSVQDVNMDITACHANGCRLDLPKLATFDEFNFIHDIFGIRRHINRETGKIEGNFTPRCAV